MSIKIEIEGIEDAIKDLDAEIALKLKMIDANLHKEVLRLEGEIKETAPVRTGRYRAAWHSSKVRMFYYKLTNNVEYAKYLIFGTRKMGIKHDVVAILKRFKRKVKSRIL